MSYTKRTWATGNVVGAVDLNRMEDGIANVDVGYSCSEGWVTLTDESVTTTAREGDPFAFGGLTYSEYITADTIKVTFNGAEYTCQKIGDAEYGASYNGSTNTFDWSEYPFNILLDSGANILATETAGTYQVKIEAYEETVETSECFGKAVRSISPSRMILTLIGDGYGSVAEVPISAQKAWEMLENDTEVVVHYRGHSSDNGYKVMYLSEKSMINEYMYGSANGNYYRFKSFSFSYDSGGATVVETGYPLDIFNPENTDEYYWVYSNYYAGKHE